MDEKLKLINALIISFALILSLSLLSIYFARLAADPPQYKEEDLEEVIAILNNSSYSLNKKQKGQIEIFFSLEGITTVFFLKGDSSLDLHLTDGRSYYIIPFKKENGSLIFNSTITNERFILFLSSDESVVIQRGDGELLEFT